MKPTPLVFLELNDKFADLKCSLASFTEHIDMLAIRLDTSEPMVSQLSPRCQPLVTLSSQNQETDIVMSEGLGVATGGKNVMESELKEKVCLWIVNKFDGVWVFISGLNSGYLGASVVVVMNSSLTKHVCKVLEVPDWLLSIKLLFKNNLSVSILGLYTGVFSVTQFFQTIDDVLISSNLVNVVVGHGMFGVEEYFDTDYQTVSVLVGLGGLLDVHLNLAKFRDNMMANAAMLYDNFLATSMYLNLDAMWIAFHKVLCLSADVVFKKK
ncbi:hypothetical protein G9A89_013209 [Geosiphon pyriformis]|nr:hypothetical protein G9A89_013209 [Geosiphon pyriformis]